jgi:osmotically inducible protein OsmC
MRISTAKAKWTGVIKSGSGEMLLGSVPFPYSFNSRMEGGPGSTPEELLAAALAGCFSMALSGALERGGFPPVSISSTGNTNFDNVNGQWTVVSIDLSVQASVPGIDDAKFQEIANGAKSGCPVSRALASVTINLSASLV